MSHNTPTAVGTSYTSAHSYNPSLPSTNNFITQPEFSSFHDHTAPSSFRPNTVPHAFPTTTVQTDSVIPNRNSFSVAPDAASLLHLSSYSVPGNQFQQPSMIHHPTQINSNQFMSNQKNPKFSTCRSYICQLIPFGKSRTAAATTAAATTTGSSTSILVECR